MGVSANSYYFDSAPLNQPGAADHHITTCQPFQLTFCLTSRNDKTIKKIVKNVK